MTEIIGIDPGPTYTGVSVIVDEVVVLSTTYKRPEDATPVWWATQVANKITTEILSRWPKAIVGIEGVVTPQSHYQGKKNLMNPKYLIFTGLMVGAISNAIPHAVIVRPGNNGSRDNYPEELTGSRPKTLEGKAVGTRQHERSAYDVAMQAPRLLKENYKLDKQVGIFDG